MRIPGCATARADFPESYKEIMNIPSLQDLLMAGAHFGHTEGHWHPKAGKYIHGSRGGIHIIDLEQTVTVLGEVLPMITAQVAQGKIVLFVGTKRQAAPIVQKYAEECGMPFITSRWLGGLLTNFESLRGMLDNYRKMLTDKERGAWEKFTKKEQVVLEKDLTKKNLVLGGIRTLRRLPDFIYIVDVRHEKTALTESRSRNVAVIAMADTNINPEHITFPIPGNDDAVKSIELFTSLIAGAVKEGMNQRVATPEEKPVIRQESKEVVASSI